MGAKLLRCALPYRVLAAALATAASAAAAKTARVISRTSTGTNLSISNRISLTVNRNMADEMWKEIGSVPGDTLGAVWTGNPFSPTPPTPAK